MNREHNEDIETAADSKEFWRKTFIGESFEWRKFTWKYDRRNRETYKKFVFKVDTAAYNMIKKIANNSEQLQFIIVFAAIVKIFSEYQENQKICLGIVPSHSNSKNSVLPVIVNLEGALDFKTLLIQLREQILQVYNHQSYPMDELLKEFGLKTDEICCITTGYENRDNKELFENRNCIFLKSMDEELELHWIANAAEEEIRSLHDSVMIILEQGLKDLEKKLDEFELLYDMEKERILRTGQGIQKTFPDNKHIYELFEETAGKYQDKIAVESLSGSVTYKELQKYINRLAFVLVNEGVSAGSRVTILADRTIETIVSIYAILKLGAAYVPVEPDYPEERIKYIISNSDSKLLLTSKSDYKTISKVLNVHLENLENLDIPDNGLLFHKPAADCSVYVIYTSGTTGKPKGVEINNKGLINLCSWYKTEVNITHTSKVILMNAFGFDASVKNIFTPLIHGATLVLGPEILFDTETTLAMLKDFQVTHLNSVPGIFYALLDSDNKNKLIHLEGLKYVILGGEALEAEPLVIWGESGLKTEIINVYGPTECTSVTTAYRLNKEEVRNKKKIPIGQPIDNKLVYVLNQNKKICPVKINGELYISGVGTAKGYIADNVNYTDVFQEDLLHKGMLMYKTGDIVRWNESGLLEFIGRNDDQVKIYGHRIELSEIENVISRYENIKKCIVLQSEGKNRSKKLYGFIIKKESGQFSESDLKNYMRAYVPSYMIPNQIIVCSEFPTTVHGKTNRKELLKYAQEGKKEDVNLKNRMTQTQKAIEEIWKELLEIDTISLNDNFFDAGGYSLLLYKLNKKIEDTFKIEISFIDLMAYTTISSLANRVEELKMNKVNKGMNTNEKSQDHQLRQNRLLKRKELQTQLRKG